MDNRDKRYIRSPKDIEKVMKYAKLAANELSSKTQTLFFSNNIDNENNIKFLELDDYLLNELSNKRTLVIKGQNKENVVLCTNEKTFDLREAEVSNSLLLIPNLELFEEQESDEAELRNVERKDVLGIYKSYIEAKVCAPRLGSLYQILNDSKFKGPENEYQIDKSNLFTYNELLSRTQASQREFDLALEKCKAIVIDGKIRILDFEYHFRVLSYMLDLIQENSWKLDEINKGVTIDSLSEIVPRSVLEKLFDFYTNPSKVINGIQYFEYDASNVCRTLAEALLKSSGKLVLNDFLQAWKESVPEGMKAEEDMLNSLAVIDRESKPNSIWLLKEEDLPEQINERFRILFQKKERWTKEQIIPYIERLATPKMDPNLMLTKYARGITVNGQKFYLAKHGK